MTDVQWCHCPGLARLGVPQVQTDRLHHPERGALGEHVDNSEDPSGFAVSWSPDVEHEFLANGAALEEPMRLSCLLEWQVTLTTKTKSS